MNKKFLSAILFGALMVTSTGTFVSCKDYDDDIENLQEQINKLATKEDMTSQIASLQSALSAAAGEAAAAKTAAQNALDKATASEKAAAQAALDAAAAKTEAIKAAQDEVANVKAELEASIDAKFEANKKELAETITKLTKKIEELTGYTVKMLTGLEIQGSSALDLNYATVAISYPKNLVKDGARQTPSSYEFGKGMPGAFTLTNGDVNTTKSTFVVKADPVNAIIAAENLSLINSKNVDIDEYVTYSVGAYNNLLSQWQSRSIAGGTGLYQIGVQLKENMTSEEFEAFDKLVIMGNDHSIDVEDCDGAHRYILHALAVTDAQNRSVTTDYAVSMHVQKEGKAENIDVRSMLYSSARHNNAGHYYDCIGNFANAGDYTASNEGAFPIVKDEAFELVVGSEWGRVMASYVVVDYDNAALSVTDKAALKGITVDGVNEVSTNNVFSLTVSGTYATGIPVPLKLVTVDYTGNVEVNVFWVKAGEPALMAADFTVAPTTYVANAEAWAAESSMEAFKVPAGTTKYTFELVVGETIHQNPAYFNEAEPFSDINKGALNLYQSDKTTKTTIVADVAYAKFVGALNLKVMREDKAYEGVIKFYDAKGTYLGSNTISVKKVLPTAIPAGLTAKTNAIHADGTLPVYPTPSNDGATGKYELSNSFNFNFAKTVDLSKLTFNTPTFKNADGTFKAEYNEFVIENIKKAIIDGTTKFPTTVKYNYGDIKYHAEGHGVADPEEYVVEWATKFDIQFGCVPAASEYAWYTAPTVYYQEETIIEGIKSVDDNGNATAWDNFLTVKNPYGKTVDAFDISDADWTNWAEALNTGANTEIKLITNGDRVNEFFTASYTVKNNKTALKLAPVPSVTTVLEADVETTVVLVIYDKFGHKHEVKALTFTMKKDRK